MRETTISENTVKKVFDQSTERFLTIAFWIGIVLNVAFSISDKIIFEPYFRSFLIFRIVVSGISAVALISYKRFNLTIYPCIFLLISGITIQNAYMWSVMDVAHFQQHAFSYVVLFIGFGMLALWETYWSLLTIAVTFIANLVFYTMNSPLTLDEWLVNGGMLTMTVALFSVFQIRTRYRLTYNDIRIRLDLEQSKKKIETQKDILEIKNREITDSIRYAKSIQEALIPKNEVFIKHFRDAFVLFEPKDIVSGDFYWIHESDQQVYYVTADCTGHGVPGGFMTMLGLSFLEEIIVNQKIEEPAEILNILRERIISTLHQQGVAGESKDGMDITVCRLRKDIRELKVASANNDVYILPRGSETLRIIKADRQPCGYSLIPKPFSQSIHLLEPGDKVYTFTDGYADQFGGLKGKKFRFKQLAACLVSTADLPMSEQSKLLQYQFKLWKGELEQVDDVLVIGIEI